MTLEPVTRNAAGEIIAQLTMTQLIDERAAAADKLAQANKRLESAQATIRMHEDLRRVGGPPETHPHDSWTGPCGHCGEQHTDHPILNGASFRCQKCTEAAQ